MPGEEPRPRAPRHLGFRRPDARPEREIRVRDRHDRNERLRAARPLRPADGLHGRPRDDLGDSGGFRLAIPASGRRDVPGRLAVHRRRTSPSRSPGSRPGPTGTSTGTSRRSPKSGSSTRSRSTFAPSGRPDSSRSSRSSTSSRRRSVERLGRGGVLPGPVGNGPLPDRRVAKGDRSGSRRTRTTGAAPRRSRRPYSAS